MAFSLRTEVETWHFLCLKPYRSVMQSAQAYCLLMEKGNGWPSETYGPPMRSSTVSSV